VFNAAISAATKAGIQFDRTHVSAQEKMMKSSSMHFQDGAGVSARVA
jgi:hypothetical protein